MREQQLLRLFMVHKEGTEQPWLNIFTSEQLTRAFEVEYGVRIVDVDTLVRSFASIIRVSVLANYICYFR